MKGLRIQKKVKDEIWGQASDIGCAYYRGRTGNVKATKS